MVYMGSKSKISKYIVPIIQNKINESNARIYIEPFVGGANIIDKISCDVKIGYDIESSLIALHKRVQKQKPLYSRVSKKKYDDARKAKRTGGVEFTLAQLGCIEFLASYNGRGFAGGYCGEPQNGKRDFYNEHKNNLMKQSKQPLYQDIRFVSKDYRNIEIPTNAVVYCDPPYSNTTEYNTKFNSEEFWDWCRFWSSEATILISEEKAPSDFKCIWKLPVNRTIDHKKTIQSVEKLFMLENKH